MLLYINRIGYRWRMVQGAAPPWLIARYCCDPWPNAGTWQCVIDQPRARKRQHAQCAEALGMLFLGNRSVKTT